MFHFLLTPIVTYNFVLVAAAVIPAVALMIMVYKADKLEKESAGLLWRLVRGGILSALLASVEEYVAVKILGHFVPENTVLYNIILYFLIVAVAEESSKYLLLKKNSWTSREFNGQFDGVVYATFVSLGFALWENISYVMSYGFSVAVVRALTAIPGHACFGVFMGVFYGAAKKYSNRGHETVSKICRFFALLFPVLLHGLYDYIATTDASGGGLTFICFVAVMFIVSFAVVKRASKNDRYIA